MRTAVARLASAVLCALAVAGFAAPAEAAIYVDPLVNMARYSPTDGSVEVKDLGTLWSIDQRFLWDNNARLNNLRNSDNDAYEGTIDFMEKPERYCFPGGTDRSSFYTDLPFGYLDTELADDKMVKRSKGGGAGNSQTVASGRYYTIYMQVANDCVSDSVASETPLRVVTQDSYRNGSCAFGYANCVTKHDGAGKDVVPVSAGWSAGDYYAWRMNRLPNPSFESGGGGWYTSATGAAGGVPSQVITGSVPFELSSFARFNCGGTGPGCKMASKVGFAVDSRDYFRHEVALRCLTAYASCPARLAVNGLGVTSPEQVSVNVTVPADGYWHYYRIRAGAWTAHNEVEFAVYNQTNSQHLEVDMGTLHWSDQIA